MYREKNKLGVTTIFKGCHKKYNCAYQEKNLKKSKEEVG